jgi:thiamine biosynthesis lipoprotein
LRTIRFAALGTTVVVAVTDDAAIGEACSTLVDQLERLDRTCSRFRSDSELQRANARAGSMVVVSPLLAELIQAALTAAETTGGCVDPTLGRPLGDAGYDRTFSLVRDRESWSFAARPVSPEQWRRVDLDARRLTLWAPQGVELDLGATAKAWASDHAARTIAEQAGCGVLVSLGGDIAVAGDAAWPIRIADHHAEPPDGDGPVVSIESGGLATSSTTVRRWRTNEGDAHHLIDPWTGRPATSCWRTVSVAAPTCLDANVAATAAIVLSHSATGWLGNRQLPARLVGAAGEVEVVGGWPSDQIAA